MASHDVMLEEIGLAPTWRLRERPGLAVEPTPSRPAEGFATREPVPQSAAPFAGTAAPDPVARDAGADASDTRVIRIANLDWGGFAQDVDACTACGLSQSAGVVAIARANRLERGYMDTLHPQTSREQRSEDGFAHTGVRAGDEKDLRGHSWIRIARAAHQSKEFTP